ncbi:hypothetical protein [Pontibacter mangrovi]|uniref:Uncharacterized protein n=1 Tax=Pontibacter mangrovi TaxID=2589816 RepID=A0A501VWY4_9BACT|nr:hypothetical protein [Pontibacter mangrovi]TPE40294.1 hypothetical protein FJM65_20355 [Pontibacter mangrovi]
MMKVCATDFCFKKACKYGLGLLLFFVAGTLPGYGQTSFEASAKHEQQLRKSLREAEKVDAKFKETHLNTDAYTFKKGASGRRRVRNNERDKMQFNVNGEPVRKLKIFGKKRKYNTRADKKRSH